MQAEAVAIGAFNAAVAAAEAAEAAAEAAESMPGPEAAQRAAAFWQERDAAIMAAAAAAVAAGDGLDDVLTPQHSAGASGLPPREPAGACGEGEGWRVGERKAGGYGERRWVMHAAMCGCAS